MKKNLMIFVIAALLITSLLAGCGQKSDSKKNSDIAGKYVRNYTDEIGGEVIDITNTIILNEDHTCEAIFQDTVTGTWTSTSIIFNDGADEYEFTLDGNTMCVIINEIPTYFEKVE